MASRQGLFKEQTWWSDKSRRQVEGGRPNGPAAAARAGPGTKQPQGTLGSVSQQSSLTVPVQHSLSDPIKDSQCPQPRTIVSFSLHFHYNSFHTTGHNAHYWLEWHSKTSTVDTDSPHSQHPNTGLTPSPPASTIPLPLCCYTMAIQPSSNPTSSIKASFVAGCDNERYQMIVGAKGSGEQRYKKY